MTNERGIPEAQRAHDAMGLVEKLEAEHALYPEEWVTLFAAQDDPTLRTHLFERARMVRDEHYGRQVFLRGLIEYSNYCKNDCYYCGIRASNEGLHRYRLAPGEILACCEQGYDLGYRTFVLQGGEDPKVPLVELVGAMRTRFPDVAITVSAGELPRETYQQLFDAGANRYLLRHETADRCHYGALHPGSMSLEARKACLFTLRAIGFQVGSGFMVGAPGQTSESMAANFAFLHELDPHMIGIGPFIPHSATPFAHKPAGTMEETLFLLACLRLAHPRALLPATTALASIDPQGRMAGLEVGANVIMPNLTPAAHRGDYALYDNKLATGLEAAEQHSELKAALAAQGYTVLSSRGDSLVV